MNAPASFPWAEVVSNAVWICGLAVILAALGWHDYRRRERAADGAAGFNLREDGRNLKVAATTRAADEPPDGAAGLPPDGAAGFNLREDGRNLKVAATTRAADEPSDGAAGLPPDGAAGFNLREDGRNLKVAATKQDIPSPNVVVTPQDMPDSKAAAATKAESLMKPVLLGLIMVAGGLALSFGSPMLSAIFAVATFSLVILFVKRFFPGRANSKVEDKERCRQA